MDWQIINTKDWLKRNIGIQPAIAGSQHGLITGVCKNWVRITESVVLIILDGEEFFRYELIVVETSANKGIILLFSPVVINIMKVAIVLSDK